MEYEQMGADSALFNFATGGIKVDFARVVGELKPGAHLLALSPIATHHSNTIGIEDAGMEIRDTLSYVFDSGGNTPDLILVTVARKSLEGTVAENVLRWGTGGLNIDKCRVGTEERPVMIRTATVVGNSCTENPTTGATSSGETTSLGRWPANLTHNNSPTVQSLFPYTGVSRGGNSTQINVNSGCYNWNTGSKKDFPNGVDPGYGDSGSAARFFYAAPSLNDLFAYLIKLVTPPNGNVLTNYNMDNLPEEYSYVTD